jgi:hypothetical protein
MTDYIFLMHNDGAERVGDWGPDLARLIDTGVFQGGTRIAGGTIARKDGAPGEITAMLGGYIRIEADDLDHARTFLAGNPAYEAGGTIEIRELPRDD